MLQGHGDHIEADDEGDKDVQVVAGTHGVDEQPGGTVGGIVGQPLGLWRGVQGTAHTRWGRGGGQSTQRGRQREGGSKGERCRSALGLGARVGSRLPSQGPQGKGVGSLGGWQRAGC